MSASDDPPDTKAPMFQAGPNNEGSVVLITAIVLLITSVLSTAARLAEIFARKRRGSPADVIIFVANIFAIGQVVCLDFAVHGGLGKHIGDVELTALITYSKALYAAQLLSILTQACTKSAVIVLGRIVHPHWSFIHQRIIIITVFVWTVFSIFGSAFECGLLQPWEYSPQRCQMQALPIHVVITTFNALTDAYLGLFMVPVVWRLKLPMTTRLTLIGFFTPRLLVCVPQLVGLVTTVQALPSQDQTWAQGKPATILQITLAMSIITANLPSMKRLLFALQTGQSCTRLTERQEAQLQLDDSCGVPNHTNGPSTISEPSTFRSRFFGPRVPRYTLSQETTTGEKGSVSHREEEVLDPKRDESYDIGIWRVIDVHVHSEVEAEEHELR